MRRAIGLIGWGRRTRADGDHGRWGDPAPSRSIYDDGVGLRGRDLGVSGARPGAGVPPGDPGRLLVAVPGDARIRRGRVPAGRWELVGRDSPRRRRRVVAGDRGPPPDPQADLRRVPRLQPAGRGALVAG